MVLEILSKSSEKKDTEILPVVYARSGVTEFWRVDGRGAEPIFEIMVLQEGAYAPAREEDSWQFSTVFKNWFQFSREVDSRNNPRFRLLVKE